MVGLPFSCYYNFFCHTPFEYYILLVLHKRIMRASSLDNSLTFPMSFYECISTMDKGYDVEVSHPLMRKAIAYA
jgi:hypothetical protein